MNEDRRRTGERIRSALRVRGMTQREAAEMLGVSLTALNHAVQGRPTVRKGTLQRIMDGLGLEERTQDWAQMIADLAASSMARLPDHRRAEAFGLLARYIAQVELTITQEEEPTGPRGVDSRRPVHIEAPIEDPGR